MPQSPPRKAPYQVLWVHIPLPAPLLSYFVCVPTLTSAHWLYMLQKDIWDTLCQVLMFVNDVYDRHLYSSGGLVSSVFHLDRRIRFPLFSISPIPRPQWARSSPLVGTFSDPRKANHFIRADLYIPLAARSVIQTSPGEPLH